MTLTAGNVLVGVTGAIYMAPTATALPTDVDDALNAAFEDVGYISENGVTTSTGTDTNDIKAWQNGQLVRRVQTSHDFTLKFSMLETNGRALKMYYGNFTAGAGALPGKVEVKATQGWRGSFVLNVVDDDNLIRVVIPDGQVTEREDVTYSNGDPIEYGVTITCYPDATDTKAYLYFEADAAS